MIDDVTEKYGWELYQSPEDMSSYITVTGDPLSEPLGISLIDGLPTQIDLNETTTLSWDVTGGDTSEMRQTQVRVETDDGIVLLDEISWGFTNYWDIDAGGNDVSGSRYVDIRLTPEDEHGAGETVRFRIPIAKGATGGRLILPGGLRTIE